MSKQEQIENVLLAYAHDEITFSEATDALLKIMGDEGDEQR